MDHYAAVEVADDGDLDVHFFTYRYDDAVWLVGIPAASKDEAEDRVAHLQWATYQGLRACEVPGWLGWWANLVCWFGNLRR